MATCVELSGSSYPKDAIPLEGWSLVPAFANQPIGREAIYWEHEGNRAVRVGDWKLVARHAGAWELYNLAKDRTETRDRAAVRPDKVHELSARYDAWAKRASVEPWPVISSKNRE